MSEKGISSFLYIHQSSYCPISCYNKDKNEALNAMFGVYSTERICIRSVCKFYLTKNDLNQKRGQPNRI